MWFHEVLKNGEEVGITDVFGTPLALEGRAI